MVLIGEPGDIPNYEGITMIDFAGAMLDISGRGALYYATWMHKIYAKYLILGISLKKPVFWLVDTLCS